MQYYLVAVLALTLPPAAQQSSKPSVISKAKEELSDVQDLFFLGDRGPVKIRLHLRVDGRPYSAAWNDYMQALFTYADRDGNGSLDEKEAKLIPSSSFLA